MKKLLFAKPSDTPQPPLPIDGYVEDGLLFFLDSKHNSPTGFDRLASTWYDISGHNRSCTLTGFSFTDDATPWLSYGGLRFNGNGQYGTIQNFSQDQFGSNFTLRAVVVFDATANYKGIAGNHGTNYGGTGVVFGQWESNSCSFGALTQTGSSRASASLPASTSMPMGTRCVIDLIYTAGTGKLYVNGVYYTDLTVTGSPITALSAGIMYVGRAYNGFDRFWLGQIYSIAGYNRALSSAEVAQNATRDRERYGAGMKVVTPTMTNNTTPSPVVISASSFWDTTNNAPWQAFNKAAKMWSGGSTELYDANGEREQGSWIKVDLNTPRFVQGLRLRTRPSEAIYISCTPKTFRLEGSNDDMNYDLILEGNVERKPTHVDQVIYDQVFGRPFFYRYYRITVDSIWGSNTNCSIGEIELYGSKILTNASYATNMPVGQPMTASSSYSSHYPSTAFSQVQGSTNETSCWASANGVFTAPDYDGGQWLQADMGSVKTVNSYIIRHRSYGDGLQPGQFPVDIGLAVSTNGTDFTTVDTRTGLAAPTAFYQPYQFELSSPASGRYVRLLITKGRSGVAAIGELELY